MLSAFITHIIWQLLAMGGWLEEYCVCLQLLVSDVFISSPSVWGWLSDPSPIWRWCMLMPNVTTTPQLLSLCSSFKGATQIIWKRYWLSYLQSALWRQRDEVRGILVSEIDVQTVGTGLMKVFTQFSLWKLRMYKDEECRDHQDNIIKLWDNVFDILILWTNWEIGGGNKAIIIWWQYWKSFK